MAIEAGARVGMVAVDDVTLEYVKGRPFAPGPDTWDQLNTRPAPSGSNAVTSSTTRSPTLADWNEPMTDGASRPASPST